MNPDNPKNNSAALFGPVAGHGGDDTRHVAGDSTCDPWRCIAVGSIVLASADPDEGYFAAQVMKVKPNGRFTLKLMGCDRPEIDRADYQLGLIHPRLLERR